MLAAKIVRFSEEKGADRQAVQVVIALVSLSTITNMSTSRVHYLQPHAQEKRRPTSNRKPPFMHFKRLNFEYVKNRGYLPGCISVILLP